MKIGFHVSAQTLSAIAHLLLWCVCTNYALAESPPSTKVLEDWLQQQSSVSTWTADVVQTRTIKNLSRALKNQGTLQFKQPNQFRWQLGIPAKTIAIRDASALLVLYPRLQTAEKYAFDADLNPKMKRALLLLEIGFPSDADAFLAQYLLDSTEQTDKGIRFMLTPKDSDAQQLLASIALTIDPSNNQLLATELFFPDGSSMKNAFSNQQYNTPLADDFLNVSLQGYELSEPLKHRK